MIAVPKIPPTDLVLKPDSSGRGLIATWKAPDPTKVNGRITYYIIKFRKVGSLEENTTGIIGVCKHQLFGNFILLPARLDPQILIIVLAVGSFMLVSVNFSTL